MYDLRRAVYIAGPLLAAAVIGLAFLGVFDRHDTRVAGIKETVSGKPIIHDDDRNDLDTGPAPSLEGDNAITHELDRWGQQLQEAIKAKRQSGESLQQVLDLTIVQWLDILEEAKERSHTEDHFPGADTAVPALPQGEAAPTDTDDVQTP